MTLKSALWRRIPPPTLNLLDEDEDLSESGFKVIADEIHILIDADWVRISLPVVKSKMSALIEKGKEYVDTQDRLEEFTAWLEENNISYTIDR